MSSAANGIEQLAINTIRTLSMDAVQAANSGHPGTPMALAPVAYALWQRFLRYDPADPTWPARDRFVLSCGHASMLLYSVLHLAGVRQVDRAGRVLDEPAVPLDEIKRFRQLHSRTPGHPEYRETGGVEMTTGPLGQGIAHSVGMAIAARWLAARLNRPGFDLFGYNVYALCSDGDLMEGVGAEAASLAGHLRLANLCWMYDDNGITIEGRTQLAFSEDVATRFAGLGWNVVRMPDANDLLAIGAAIREFLETDDRPTLIVVRSHIAYGAPHKQDTHEAHGAPLGEEEIRLTKRGYGWPEDAKFHVPAEVPAHFQAGIGRRGAQERRAWTEKLAAYRQAHPDLARQWDLIQAKQLPAGWDAAIPVFPADVKGADVKGADVKGADVKGADVKGADAKGLATRAASGKVLNAVAQHIPWLVGGSADLSPSTNTMLLFEGAGEFQAGQSAGRNFHFGIREHGMAAALGGMALCGLRPYGGTFFVFSDYLRPAMRLAALMRLPVLYVFTHDSIGLGEDGPTHQPIEHLAACRAIPGLVVLRPGDANEVAEAYRTILSRAGGPVALVLTRQNVPTLDRTRFACAAGLARGAYVLADPPDGMPELILIGTGSELSLCVAAYETLTAEGRRVRVVSMPSWELFDVQDDAYRDAVLPPQVTARVAVEAGIGQGWQRYLGPRGRFLGLTTFGASAPAGQLFSHFGLTLENVLKAAKEF